MPVDFSETSKKAFLYALKFAEQFSCEITLLIVVQPMSPMVGAPLVVEAFSDAEDEFSEGKEAWPCSRPSHTLTARILLIRASVSDMRPTRSRCQGSGYRPDHYRYSRLYQLATSVHRQHSGACRAYRAVSRAGGPREGARVHLANSERFGENEVKTKFYNRNRTTSRPRGAGSFSGRDGSHAARPAYRLRNRCSLFGG